MVPYQTKISMNSSEFPKPVRISVHALSLGKMIKDWLDKNAPVRN